MEIGPQKLSCTENTAKSILTINGPSRPQARAQPDADPVDASRAACKDLFVDSLTRAEALPLLSSTPFWGEQQAFLPIKRRHRDTQGELTSNKRLKSEFLVDGKLNSLLQIRPTLMTLPNEISMEIVRLVYQNDTVGVINFARTCRRGEAIALQTCFDAPAMQMSVTADKALVRRYMAFCANLNEPPYFAAKSLAQTTALLKEHADSSGIAPLFDVACKPTQKELAHISVCVFPSSPPGVRLYVHLADTNLRGRIQYLKLKSGTYYVDLTDNYIGDKIKELHLPDGVVIVLLNGNQIGENIVDLCLPATVRECDLPGNELKPDMPAFKTLQSKYPDVTFTLDDF